MINEPLDQVIGFRLTSAAIASIGIVFVKTPLTAAARAEHSFAEAVSG